MELASKGDMSAALDSINKAIEQEPREAMFFALRGRIYKEQKQMEKAQADFDKAVSLYPEMFQYQLYNGLNSLAMNNLDKARGHLERANQVVPTSIAYLRLGDIASRQNRRNDAIGHYSKAAEAGGDVGEEAKRQLADLSQ
jgi:tetratricopeptide (TPR) repeat protein